jgi:signal transduction histidine kinase
MFAAILSHDLRTPLGAILSGAQLLQVRSDDELVQRTAERMLSSGKRMARLVEDLLDLTRARLAGGIPIVRAHTDLGMLVQRVVQEQHGAHPEARIDVTTAGDLTGDWDSERLAQVVSNLLGNALQHGVAGEPVRVRLDGTRADSVMVAVSNAGEIAPDVLPRLFDPFRRSVPGSGRPHGLGLGLYIAQQIVLAHRGSVAVQSRPDTDVTFEVTIPRAGAGENAASA